MKKKVYLDISKVSVYRAIFFTDDEEVIFSGTRVIAESISCKDEAFIHIARESDIRVIFEDDIPVPGFFAVPNVDIIAQDSNGGYIGNVGGAFDIGQPAYYISSDMKCFKISESIEMLLDNPSGWKEHMVPYEGVMLYPSKAEAEKEYEFMVLE